MNKKEEFLAIRSYEEFDKRRTEFEELKMTDKEVRPPNRDKRPMK